MNHVERGFVVPVWIHWTEADGQSGWGAAWADASCRSLVRDGGAREWAVRPGWLRARDPNRKDQGDRPDLTEGG